MLLGGRLTLSEAFRAGALGLTQRWSGQDHGRLLVLGESPGWPGAMVADGSMGDPFGDVASQHFDTVLAVLWLARQPLPADGAVRALRRMLWPNGRLLMVEPVRRPGHWGQAASWIGSVVEPASAPALGATAPALLRAQGFNVASVERISMPRRHGLAPTLARIEARPTPDVVAARAGAGIGRAS